MTPSSDWYVRQADLLYGRADACLQLAGELELAPLVSLLGYAGDDTWQGPAAGDFREVVVFSHGKLLDAIEGLRANALGLGNEGDNMSRSAAHAAESEREAARQRSEANQIAV
jgi:hypothetical protein